MKVLFVLIALCVSGSILAQEKKTYYNYNMLTQLDGTSYVIASAKSHSKVGVSGNYILFINSKTGESKQVNFKKNEYVYNIEQVKIDSLNINRVAVALGILNLKDIKGVESDRWERMVILSTDGSQYISDGDHPYYYSERLVNRQTGTVITTGFVDVNDNDKHDPDDKTEVRVYDLKNMKIVAKIKNIKVRNSAPFYMSIEM